MLQARSTAPLSLMICVLLWQALAQMDNTRLLIAGPIDVIVTLHAEAGLLTRALAATLQSAAWGFVWGNLAAIALASFAVLFPRLQRIIAVLALVIFCLPLVATGPILRVLFGPGDGPQVTLAALAVYYTTFLALMAGLRAMPQSWLDLTHLYGRNRLTQLIHIRSMASLPYLIAGLQISAPAAILGAMIGEFTGAERGLGVLTLRAMRSLDVNTTWTLATIAAGASILVFSALGWLGRRLSNHPPALLLSPPALPLHTPIGHKIAHALGLAAGIVLLWHVTLEAFQLPHFFAKRPDDVWRYLISDEQARVTLSAALGETLALTLPGYIAGLALGAGLAAAVTLTPRLSSVIMPAAIALRSVPIITTAPLIILLLGRGAIGTISVVAVMIFFPTFVACLQGIRQTPGQIIELFQTYRASPLRLLLWARVPAMLPAFFASARMAIPAALLAATTTEWLATGRGVGNLMALTASTSNYNMLWSAVAALACLATLSYLALEQLEALVAKTYAAEQLTP